MSSISILRLKLFTKSYIVYKNRTVHYLIDTTHSGEFEKEVRIVYYFNDFTLTPGRKISLFPLKEFSLINFLFKERIYLDVGTVS